MTTDTISGAYPGGFTLSASFSGLDLTDTASVGGTGVILTASGTVFNHGQIAGGAVIGDYSGISLEAGGTVINYGPSTVSGHRYGVLSRTTSGSTTVTNYGAIEGSGSFSTGADLFYGGRVLNYGLISGESYGVVIRPESGSTAPLGTVINYGTISGGSTAGGETGAIVYGNLTNGSGGVNALISGFNGVEIMQGTVANFGSIQGSTAPDQGIGVILNSDASLINGSAVLRSATISGYEGVTTGLGYGSIANFGTIIGVNYAGVYLSGASSDGGGLVNGSGSDTVALISGVIGVEVGYDAPLPIKNFGTIQGTGPGAKDVGVLFTHGGAVVNGAATSKAAVMEGYEAVQAQTIAATVTNFGTMVGFNNSAVEFLAGGRLVNSGGVEGVIDAVYVGGGAGTISNSGLLYGKIDGVYLRGGGDVTNTGVIDGSDMAAGEYGVVFAESGRLTNGSSTTAGGNIVAYGGVLFEAGKDTVVNFGQITGTDTDGSGVALFSGSVTNGSVSDTEAEIHGGSGVVAFSTATVNNFGIVEGGDFSGVTLGAGGKVVNGSAGDLTALIKGKSGVYASGAAATIINYGTVDGYEDGKVGVQVNGAGSRITNGSATDTGARIVGQVGVSIAAGDILTNFGTIVGYGGVATALTASSAKLMVEAGSEFDGAVNGDGGTLVLDSGVGTISGQTGGNLIVSGSMEPTTFSGFGTVEISAGAKFTVASNTTITSGTELNNSGTLAVTGALVSAGALAGTGVLDLSGGSAAFDTGASLTVSKVTEVGAAALATFASKSLTYAGRWAQTSGTVSVATGDKVNFSGTGDTFSGTLSGAGTVDFSGGTVALSGTHIEAVTVIGSAATVTMSGAVDLTDTLTIASSHVIIATAGATLSGGGAISLSNLATNTIKGASASARLTNVNDAIKGAGQLGDGEMALTNDAGGTVQGNLSTALVIDTGTSTLINAGMIENTSTGGVTIVGAVNNTGTLNVTKGVLSVEGAVTGAGTVRISGGTADFGSAFTENVTFTAVGGTLELAKSQSYTGQITGFAKTLVSSLDLLDIAFGSKTKATFSGTTASGVLTVTDGTHTSKITLVGNYTSSTFTTASDGHGGTTVTDPPAQALAPTSPLPLITALAGFGASPAVSSSVSQAAWLTSPPALSLSGAHHA